ncbi:MAG: thioredoxin domain-containing protein, partial [Acidobacteriota bacterium]
DELLVGYLAQLPPTALQGISDARAILQRATVPPGAAPPPGDRVAVVRAPEAPVQIVDFSDIKCSHCANLDRTMRELHRILPPGSYAHEARWYPLDADCNASLDPAFTGPDDVRCLAPKVLGCVHRARPAQADELRARFFEEQQTLTAARIDELTLAIAGLSADALAACLEAPDADAALAADVAYADRYAPEGTPLVVINGRQGVSYGPFLYALILARGDVDHPAFGALPPPAAELHMH